MASCALEGWACALTGGFLVEDFWFPTCLGSFCFILQAGHSFEQCLSCRWVMKETAVGGKVHSLPKRPCAGYRSFLHVQMRHGRKPVRESEDHFYDYQRCTWRCARFSHWFPMMTRTLNREAWELLGWLCTKNWCATLGYSAQICSAGHENSLLHCTQHWCWGYWP